MTGLVLLFVRFFTIGLFSFGGGYAVLSFLQHEVVRRGWMSPERFVDMIAIAQSTPGPIAINMATFTGYEVGGVWGALVASVAVVLPGTLLMLGLAMFFFHFYEHPRAKALFYGLRPAVVGLIAAAAWQIATVALLRGDVCVEHGGLLQSIHWGAVAVTGGSVVLIQRWRMHPLWLVLGAAVAGILFF